jgi:RNA polymerase sigma factor (sigma-70 family)
MAEPIPPAQETTDMRRDLANALEQLPERCRSLLSLRYQGFEPLEVAERLGYSQTSISKVTNRCLAALTRRLLTSGLPRRKTH